MALLLLAIERLLSILVVGYVVLTYFSAPTNPVRIALAKFIEPVLQLIRKFLPPIKSIDFSPLILLLIIQLFYILGLQLIRMTLPK
jgi:uncharacterized protein YggT (Ycf19 family)